MRVSLCVITLLSVSLAACSSYIKDNTGTSYGSILVGSPRVDSRDRLLNKRNDQLKWLTGELTKVRTADPTLAGSIRRRNIDFSGTQAGISFDPLRRLQQAVSSAQLANQLA